MRLATDKVLREIQEYLENTAWIAEGEAHHILTEAQDVIESQRRQLRHLEKSIVWYQDITMTGTHSEDYENGFWDAVDFVKWHQLEVTQTGHN